MFRKILIANRGEIAVRVMRTCRELGIPTVALYAPVDRRALHVRMAEEAQAIENYLRIDAVIEAAQRAGADAIHPGYGFLSENPGMPRACEAAGIVFIGPSGDAMEKMGSKTSARRAAIAAGAPVVPGTEHGLRDAAEGAALAAQFGYPAMLKAAAGGGGKGMRLVQQENEMAAAFRDACSEALNAFGNDEVYVEKCIERPRHIEIQVFGDRHGNMVYLGERECSIQRRHQKVVEECPSPFVDAGLRSRMGEAAVGIARTAGYYNAGTMEFLVDAHRNFYFLEMNTRLQVEHPVTEIVTGLDLVKLQIAVAAGEPLPFKQEDVTLKGWAVECRVYAEDPDNNFFPSPGRITALNWPSGPGVRVDSGVYEGWTVPMDYDPMIAKMIGFGATRAEAIARLRRALGECVVAGIRTNTQFFQRVLDHPDFLAGDMDTGFIGRLTPEAPTTDEAAEEVAALATALHEQKPSLPVASAENRWKNSGRLDLMRKA